ncbi:MAG: valine--tRNA ligase [Clostridiales bacterium]|nr:valine--tRNA ligase [Clostridiales bacterium]
MELPKTYDPSAVEPKWYKIWEESGYFHAVPNPEKKPFCIMMPPPNITGVLHMGHAVDQTPQDIFTRWRRMQGYEALWLPGTDHASIATEVKIVEKMASEGLTKAMIGREAFLERAWAWRAEYGGTIVRQSRALGSSADWARERFTMDEGCSRAVLDVFMRLYNKGLIYRGHRIVNWCPTCKTALSDAEVEFEEQQGHLWHIRYDAPDKSYSVTVATTRPETMLGDLAVAVHPEDARYKDIIGKTVILPLMEREIPVVADTYCEMEFGTGAVKITPSHDPNDFEVGARHGLGLHTVMHEDGTINELGGQFAGLDRYAARKAIVQALEASGQLVKTEGHLHNVGTCYRCHHTIESLVSKQWFVSMKPLAERAIAAVKAGAVRFVPERMEHTFLHWMENIRDWCISRQLWWGHRIPAYYCDCGEITVTLDAPDACPHCSGALRQDADVLDTWFSSGLWPFSTLGYPDRTPELEYFYPNTMLVAGTDLIFFWIARMIVFGLEVMGEVPFATVCFNGILRDALGRKMSKSLGNGIDPLEVIEKYGADSLRYALITGASVGNDSRFREEKVESARNFCNKLYNAARFIRMQVEKLGGADFALPDADSLGTAERWILTRLQEVIEQITAHLEGFDLNQAGQKIYDFIWGSFCDWYIELTKPALQGDGAGNTLAVLLYVFRQCLQLLHPYMPFITEELYQALPGAEATIMRSAWPVACDSLRFAADAARMETVMELVRAIRNARAEKQVPPAQKIEVLVVSGDATALSALGVHIQRLVNAQSVGFVMDAPASEGAIHIIVNGAEAYLPLASLVDMEKERARAEKERARLEGEIARAQGKLANEGFIAKAPPAVVEEERRKLGALLDMLEKAVARETSLGLRE